MSLFSFLFLTLASTLGVSGRPLFDCISGQVMKGVSCENWNNIINDTCPGGDCSSLLSSIIASLNDDASEQSVSAKSSTAPSSLASPSTAPTSPKTEQSSFAPSTINDPIADCLALHNKARQEVGLPALTWSTTLAESASQYSAELYKKDPSSSTLVHSNKPGVGENLYAASGNGASSRATCVLATQAWLDEKPLYSAGTPIGSGDFHAYGHYTQIVYRTVTQVGCSADGAHGGYVTCHYDQVQISDTLPY